MRRLEAFTIPELLIYMIIAGVVLLAVMEGFTLLGNYTQKRTEKILATADIYDNYRRLVGFTDRADSIGEDYGFVELLDNGVLYCEMSVGLDSLLVVNRNYTRDTLFRRVVGFASINDTLLLEILNDRDSLLRFRFAVVPDQQKTTEQRIEDKEREYRYE